MAEYRVIPGSFSVSPVKPSYASGENVGLKIKCQVQRKNGVGSMLAWSSTYKVYKKDNSLLASDSRSHSMSPWTDIDTGNDDFTINIGAYNPGLLEGYVVVEGSG